MRLFNWLTIAVASVGAIFSHLLGGFDILVKSILILVIIDYLTGIIKAVSEKKLNSAIGFKGIVKKIFIFLVIMVSVIIQDIIIIDFPLRDSVIWFFIGNECISILENTGTFIPIPKKLRDIILTLRGSDDE